MYVDPGAQVGLVELGSIKSGGFELPVSFDVVRGFVLGVSLGCLGCRGKIGRKRKLFRIFDTVSGVGAILIRASRNVGFDT